MCGLSPEEMYDRHKHAPHTHLGILLTYIPYVSAYLLSEGCTLILGDGIFKMEELHSVQYSILCEAGNQSANSIHNKEWAYKDHD